MAFRFLPHETEEMERILDSRNNSTPKQEEIHEIAARFTAAREKNNLKGVLWKQIWNWFQNKRHIIKKGGRPQRPKQGEGGSATNRNMTAQHSRGDESGVRKYIHSPTTGPPHMPPASTPPNPAVEFEARSARDEAWYDVDHFLGTQRQTAAGETEVQVVFTNFSEDDAEWVTARTSVRQRSLPCESSECVVVLPNDIVLTFQEANEQALYFDADVLDVQRRRHDVRGCRCRFWVRYRHDGNEEVVPLRKLCRRPETDFRLRATAQASASWTWITGGGTITGNATGKMLPTGLGGAAPLTQGAPQYGAAGGSIRT